MVILSNMFTGYFAKLKEYKKAGLIPVSIALKSPDWYYGLEYKKLAPTWDILNSWKNGVYKNDINHYTQEFKKQILDKLDINTVLHDLLNISENKLHNVILLCYEKPGDFCHRHLVADWITEIGQFISYAFIGNVIEYDALKIILTNKDCERLKEIEHNIR